VFLTIEKVLETSNKVNVEEFKKILKVAIDNGINFNGIIDGLIRKGVTSILLFNSLSWKRKDIVEN